MNKIAGPWTYTDQDKIGVYRAIKGKDGNDIANRVAFIEKTPRVRIREDYLGVERGSYEDGEEYKTRRWPEHLDWCSGYKGDGPDDTESREWCDRMLTALGYTVEN